MIKIYGMDTCPDCIYLFEQIRGREEEFQFIDLGEHVRLLKEFLRLRDNHSVFAACKKNGYAGIPCFVREDQTVTLCPQEVGLKPKPEEMSRFLVFFNYSVSLVVPALEHRIRMGTYIKALVLLTDEMLALDKEPIPAMGLDPAVENSIAADRNLIRQSFPKEADRVSLLSTLVIYEQCRREGMKNHSKAYMDRVTELRKRIDAYYNDTSQQFCGS